MMFKLSALIYCLTAVVSLILAATLPTQPLNENFALIQDILNSTNGEPIIFPTTTNLNTSSSSPGLAEEPWCTDALGVDLDPVSCANAISKITRSTDIITIGYRGRGNFDITLPYIWMSGKFRFHFRLLSIALSLSTIALCD